MTTRVTPSSASQSPSSSSAAVIVETVRTSCIRCRPGPGTRAQHTTSALATSKAATRSMISGSSVSTRIALASGSDGGGHPQKLQGTANLILVLEAHVTALSAAPGARLQDGLERPSHHDVDGRPRSIFSPERLSPTRDIQDFRDKGHVPEAAGPSGATRFRHRSLAQRSQARADLFCEEVRLLPGCKVPARGQPIVVDEVGVGLFCPTPRHLIELVRKDAHGYRDGDALRAEEGQLVFPIETSRRDPRGRQPVVGDVVEHVVSGEALGLTVEDTGDQRQTSRVVVEQPGGQADG